MKAFLISRRDAKTQRFFLGELCGFARDIFEIWLINKEIGQSRIADQHFSDMIGLKKAESA